MLSILKDNLGLSIAGGVKKYAHRNKSNRSVFDMSSVVCKVFGWTHPRKSYQYYASCYCDDAPAFSNWLTVYTSKKYASRQEAEAALDLDIIHASQIFKESAFYRERYYPEHDAVGETLCCRNGVWAIEADDIR
jgi:hypothetical protein